MTVLTTASQVTYAGNASTTVFSYNFLIPGTSATDPTNVQVTYTDTNGNVTVLSPSQFSIAGVNSPAGGTVTFLVNAAPIPSGSSLNIRRVVPYTQPDTIENQGNFYPAAVDDMVDNVELQVQQLLDQQHTINFRGTWITATRYAYGDLVVDGVNGADTQNVYFCVIPNTSGVWATDLAAGDWSLAMNFAQQLATFLTGGTINQLIKKNSSTNFDASWYAETYEMSFRAIGVLSDSQVVGYWMVTANCTIPQNFAAISEPGSSPQSEASAVANAAGSAVFNFDKRTSSPNTWTTEGTVTFGSGGITPTFASSAAISLVKGDIVRIIGPSTHDSALASPTFNLVASRP